METVVIEMKREKDCKHSVRYSAEAEAHVQNIYLSRKAAETMPERIRVTIENVK